MTLFYFAAHCKYKSKKEKREHLFLKTYSIRIQVQADSPVKKGRMMISCIGKRKLAAMRGSAFLKRDMHILLEKGFLNS
jgi:hypothetical protein